MTVTVKHSKTNAISDWTQAQLDEQIELGNFAPGTTLAQIVLPSDWNNDHTLTGVGTMAEQDANNVAITGGSINGTTIGATTASTGRFSDLTDTGLTSGRVTYATTGGNLTDSANLTFNGTTLTTTGVVTPSVTATTNDLTLNTAGSGVIRNNLPNSVAWQMSAPASTVTRFMAGGQSVLEARLCVPSFLRFQIGSTADFTGEGSEQMRITNTTSAVNFVQVTGAATTASPTISAQGSDSNVALQITSKSAGNINLGTGGGTQFRVGHIGSAVNILQVAGSATGQAPVLSTQPLTSDTNVSMALRTTGTGAINLAAGSSGVNISNGGTVTAVTVTNNGSAYTSAPTWSASAPTTAGGVTSTGTTVVGASAALTINAGGTGYTVGNVLTVTGGTSTQAAQITVSAVSSGVITAATVTTFGQYSVVPTSPVSVTGGTGSGATFTLTYFVRSLAIGNAGSGYIEQPTVTFSGGGGSGAAAYASVGGGSVVRALGTTFNLNNSAGTCAQISNTGTGTSVNFPVLLGAPAGSGPTIDFNGSDANVVGLFTSKGASSAIGFAPNYAIQLRVPATASAVNFVQVTGAVTTGQPTISAQGSDTNVSLSLASKGTGIINLQQATNLGRSSTNWLQVAGSGTGLAPSITSVGGDTNIDLSLTPKGTGVVQFGTHTANADVAISGFITIRDAGGTLRKLAVIT